MQWKADPANAGKDASVGLTQFPGAITQGDLTQETKTPETKTPTQQRPISITRDVDPSNPGEKETLKLTASEQQAYNKALDDWTKKKAAAVVPGTLWGTNPDPDFDANNPKPDISDFIGQGSPIPAPNPAQSAAQIGANLSPNPAFQSSPSGGGNLSTGKDFQTPQTKKAANAAAMKMALDKSNGDVTSARQWLEDNGYTIPQ